MTAPLTSQEKRVLLFLLFLFALGLFLSFLKKTSGGYAGLALDINRATREELIAVPLIGAKTADAIIATRSANGPIRSLDELKNIKGMTDKKISSLKDYLYVNKGAIQ